MLSHCLRATSNNLIRCYKIPTSMDPCTVFPADLIGLYHSCTPQFGQNRSAQPLISAWPSRYPSRPDPLPKQSLTPKGHPQPIVVCQSTDGGERRAANILQILTTFDNGQRLAAGPAPSSSDQSMASTPNTHAIRWGCSVYPATCFG